MYFRLFLVLTVLFMISGCDVEVDDPVGPEAVEAVASFSTLASGLRIVPALDLGPSNYGAIFKLNDRGQGIANHGGVPMLWEKGTWSPLPSGTYAHCRVGDLNNLGVALGRCTAGETPPESVIWDRTELKDLSLPGGLKATHIDDFGRLVIYPNLLWDGEIKEISAPEHSEYTGSVFIQDMSDDGQLVARLIYKGTDGRVSLRRVGTWNPETKAWTIIQDLDGYPIILLRINDSGQVSGARHVAGLGLEPFFWDGVNLTIIGPFPRGGWFTVAWNLNNRGQVLVTEDVGPTGKHPDHEWYTYLWENGELKFEFGGLSANRTWAHAINNVGQAAGHAAIHNDPWTYNAAFWEFAVSPTQQIKRLARQVSTLTEAGILSGGEATSLTSKLDAALQQLEAGKIVPAINQLGAFINQVEALVRSGRLSEADGQALIDAAQRVIDQLNEG